MSISTQERATIAPSHTTQLRDLSRFLDEEVQSSPCLISSTGVRHEIPEEVYYALVNVVEALSHGRGVSVVPTNRQLTTQQAADFLSISRPTLVKLLEQGDIPFTKVGRHRRVTLEDLVAYETRTQQSRQRTLSRLTAEASADGTYFASPASTKTR